MAHINIASSSLMSILLSRFEQTMVALHIRPSWPHKSRERVSEMACISFLLLQLIPMRDVASLPQLRHHRKLIPRYLLQDHGSRQSGGHPRPLEHSTTITRLQDASLLTRTTLHARRRHPSHKPEPMRTLRIPAPTHQRPTHNLLATTKSVPLPQNPQPHHRTAPAQPRHPHPQPTPPPSLRAARRIPSKHRARPSPAGPSAGRSG